VTNVSRGVSVYSPVFTGTHYTYPGGMTRLSWLEWMASKRGYMHLVAWRLVVIGLIK